MYDDYLKEFPMMYAITPSKARTRKNIAAVFSLIEKEESPMTKRKRRLKPLIIAAAVMIFMLALVVTVNAATEGGLVKFFMGGKEIGGDYSDYVDHKGYRHISFAATLPIYEENFAIIFDVDAPREEAVRVITDDTDREFMDRIRQYRDAEEKFFKDLKAWYAENNITIEDRENPDSEFNKTPHSAEALLGRPFPEPEDFGLVFKESELCQYRLGYVTKVDGFDHKDGQFGGEFMQTGAAWGHPSGSDDEHPNECYYDWENEIKTFRVSYFYYVGKE